MESTNQISVNEATSSQMQTPNSTSLFQQDQPTSNPKPQTTSFPSSDDPLKKREQFAISLRKAKKNDILQRKRDRLIQRAKNDLVQVNANQTTCGESQSLICYSICPLFTDYQCLMKHGETQFVTIADPQPLESQQTYSLQQLVSHWCPDYWTNSQDLLVSEIVEIRVQMLINAFEAIFNQTENSDSVLIPQLGLIVAMRQETKKLHLDPDCYIQLASKTTILDFIKNLYSFINSQPNQQNQEQVMLYLKIELTWILSNMFYGSKQIVEYLILDQKSKQQNKYQLSSIMVQFQKILRSKDQNLLIQVFFCYGNIFYDDLDLDLLQLIEKNSMAMYKAIYDCFQEPQILCQLKTDSMFLLSAIVKKNLPSKQSLKIIIAIVTQCLKTTTINEKDTVVEALKTYLSLIDKTDYNSHALLIDEVMIKILIQFLEDKSDTEVSELALKILSAISACNNEFILELLKFNVLDSLYLVFEGAQEQSVIQNVIYTVSNMMASQAQVIIARVLDHALWDVTIMALNSPEMKIKNEALIASFNFIITCQDNLMVKTQIHKHNNWLADMLKAVQDINKKQFYTDFVATIQFFLDFDATEDIDVNEIDDHGYMCNVDNFFQRALEQAGWIDYFNQLLIIDKISEHQQGVKDVANRLSKLQNCQDNAPINQDQIMPQNFNI